ncbi:hypothetical protein DID88_005728 [Monilinia fructigena]|uniref:Uncharacterized protein n=1 Tax=Monilinia fructigena TaxID=38457 RepID=A0A395J1R8_9HELO|nr:hypothetical protein DID88_005728 [Monilinia fructigena]
METRQVRIGGRNGKVKTVSLDTLLTPSTPPLSPISIDECNEEVDAGHLCAIGYAGGNFVTIDSRHTIEIWGKDDEDADHGFSKYPATGTWRRGYGCPALAREQSDGCRVSYLVGQWKPGFLGPAWKQQRVDYYRHRSRVHGGRSFQFVPGRKDIKASSILGFWRQVWNLENPRPVYWGMYF